MLPLDEFLIPGLQHQVSLALLLLLLPGFDRVNYPDLNELKRTMHLIRKNSMQNESTQENLDNLVCIMLALLKISFDVLR